MRGGGAVLHFPRRATRRSLDIVGTGITDEVLVAIGEHCPSFMSLDAKGCVFGLPHGAHTNKEYLASMSVKSTDIDKRVYGVTDRGVERLVQRLKYCRK